MRCHQRDVGGNHGDVPDEQRGPARVLRFPSGRLEEAVYFTKNEVHLSSFLILTPSLSRRMAFLNRYYALLIQLKALAVYKRA